MKMGTSAKTALIYVVGLSLLLVAAVFIQAFAATATANVAFEPDTIDLGAPGWTVKEVMVTVWFSKGKYDGTDIDPKTVLIEGLLSPKGGWKRTWTEHIKVQEGDKWKMRWVFRFKVAGGDMRDLLWSLIPHMNPGGGEQVIPLEVAGLFYDGNAFSGTGYITTYVPSNPPPPPPP